MDQLNYYNNLLTLDPVVLGVVFDASILKPLHPSVMFCCTKAGHGFDCEASQDPKKLSTSTMSLSFILFQANPAKLPLSPNVPLRDGGQTVADISCQPSF